MRVLRSVKSRLVLTSGIILTALLSGFGFLMHAELSRALYRDVDKTLQLETRTLQESMQGYLEKPFGEVLPVKDMRFPGPFLPLSAELNEELHRTLGVWEKQERFFSRSTLMVRILGTDHAQILGNLTGWERAIIFPDFERDSVFMETGESFQTIHFQKKPVRLYYLLLRIRHHPLLVIQCGMPLYELESALHRLRLILWIFIPGAVAAASAVGWIIVRHAFRPVDSMIREAQQITAAYLPARLPRTGTGDELDRLAETLNGMMDRIESSTRAIQDFSSDISHELKTPLAIIRGEIDLALRRARSPEAMTETFHVIGGEVNELIRLVDDLLLLVRSDSKQLRLEKRKIVLGEILRQTAQRFHERGDRKKIEFSVKTDQDAVVEGDPVYLKRLFSNLLDNAFKFTPEGGRIWVELKASPGWAIVDVCDSGMGIEFEIQQKVFSRFYRADQARAQEGAGLGLNIAKAICDAHGGVIQITSKPGAGTRVSVQFPSF